jgi:methyl-accepting chemotaxis protein
METIESALGTLRSCSSELLSLNRSTEDDFLTVGSRLREVSAQSDEVSRKAKSAADLISSDEVGGWIREIQELLDLMKMYLDASRQSLRSNAETIKDILITMESISTSLSGFASIVKRLSILSISTKIEASRISDVNNSFGSLARDIEALSATIGVKSKHIRDTIKSLRTVIGDTLSKASAFDASENEHAKALLDGVMGSLLSLREKHAASSKTACFLAQRTDEMCTVVGEIVSSLQFHDITRQQIEHVVQAIDELCGKTPDDGCVEDPRSSLAGLPIGDVCAVLTGQLSNARQQLLAAMGGILDNLQQMSKYAAEVLCEVATLTETADQAGSSFLARLKEEGGRIIASLKENGEANSRLVAAVERVVGTTRELSGFVEEVEAVGEEIELIALNARVKAARAGTEGAPLSVLAESIRELSENARHLTEVISRILHQVGSAADGLATDAGRGEKGLQLDDATGRLGNLFDSFGDMDARVTALVRPIELVCSELESQVKELVSGITVQRRAGEILEKVATNLADVARASEVFAPKQPGPKDGELLRRLEERYTMHKERSVHQSVFGGSVFRQHGAASDFGDNVELF